MSRVWEPDPAWQRLPGAGGPSSEGIWLAEDGGRTWVVKRLRRPEPGRPDLTRPDHAGYWLREAQVALHPRLVDGPGLVPPEFGPVEEDAAGVTLRSLEWPAEALPGLFVARALGRFAAAPYEAPSWASRHLLVDRLAMAEDRGGWPTLARTTLADVTDALWQRRHTWTTRLEKGPHGRLHGDAVPRNFLARRGPDVVTVDWQCFGIGPVGTDVGYLALSSREDFAVLVNAFAEGACEEQHDVDLEAVTLTACVTAVYTVLSRAEWALARAAQGEGALAGKFRHPAVAPYLRAVQRQFPQIERLLG
jgi:hypothetical protein